MRKSTCMAIVLCPASRGPIEIDLTQQLERSTEITTRDNTLLTPCGLATKSALQLIGTTMRIPTAQTLKSHVQASQDYDLILSIQEAILSAHGV